jgi:ABC-type Na+ efflux pump permease subunit
MKKVHLIFGIFVLIIFVLTGQYMDRHFNHLVGMPDAPRLLYRTRHIFILFSGLLNLALAAYFTARLERRQRILQTLGSLLIVAASILFIVAFFYEPKLQGLYTPLSHRGAYMIAGGTLFHLLSSVRQGGAAINRKEV